MRSLRRASPRSTLRASPGSNSAGSQVCLPCSCSAGRWATCTSLLSKVVDALTLFCFLYICDRISRRLALSSYSLGFMGMNSFFWMISWWCGSTKAPVMRSPCSFFSPFSARGDGSSFMSSSEIGVPVRTKYLFILRFSLSSSVSPFSNFV